MQVNARSIAVPTGSFGREWPASVQLTSTGIKTLTPLQIDGSWRALGQSWRQEGVESGFEPGWARIKWDVEGLYYDAIFVTGKVGNRAQRLNERMWELGDVCEVFLQTGRDNYLELQVTPENQRLQLCWSSDGRNRVLQGAARLDDFLVSEPNWVQTTSHVAISYWVIQAVIPAREIFQDGRALAPGADLHTAVTRYDYGVRRSPVISSTSLLSAPDFHRRAEWDRLVLRSDQGEELKPIYPPITK